MICVERVVVSPDSIVLKVGEWFYNAKAYVYPTNATDKEVVWSSGKPSVASVNETNGYIRANSVGTTKIYARAVDGSGEYGYVLVEVTDKVKVSSVCLNKRVMSLEKGHRKTLKATVCPENASDKSLRWCSSDETVATVIGGEVTGKKAGMARITAVANDGSGQYDFCNVYVEENILPTWVGVNATKSVFDIGDTGFVCETVYPENATNKTVTWSSSAPNVVFVNPTSGLLIARSQGEATITATSNADKDIKGHYIIKVNRKTYNVSNIKIYQSPRKPGKNEDCSIAQDMIVNDKSKLELYNMFFHSGSFCVGNIASEYDENPTAVENKMYELATLFCANNEYMWLSTRRMINHFLEGTGTDFREPILTLHAYSHESTQRFVTKTKERIINYLANNNGDIYALSNSKAFSDDITDNVGRPHYDMPEDLWNGLKICVNDTWGNFIEIKDYSCDGCSFTGTIKYTIYDHFGLEDDDITSGSWYLSGVIPNLDQFVAWYVLQHYEGCKGKYKPFVTYMEMEIPFSGCIS